MVAKIPEGQFVDTIKISVLDIVDVSTVLPKEDFWVPDFHFGFTVYLGNGQTHEALYSTKFEAVASREALIGKWQTWVKTGK